MTYTVIYEQEDTGNMGTFTFMSSRHDKNYAWTEFQDKYAENGQRIIALMPGHQIVYFDSHISFTNVA
jgi:hypothetical protein